MSCAIRSSQLVEMSSSSPKIPYTEKPSQHQVCLIPKQDAAEGFTTRTHASNSPLLRYETYAIPNRAYCDQCRHDLDSTRIICVDCSETEVDSSIDLCLKCFREDPLIKKEVHGKVKLHQSSHVVLAIRMPLIRSFKGYVFRRARNELDSLLYYILPSEEDEVLDDPEQNYPECHACETPIKTGPYWNCIDCRSTYLRVVRISVS
jgi:hypothetical protein